LQKVGCFFEWDFPHFAAVKSVGFQFNHQSDCTSGASLSKAGMTCGIQRLCLSDQSFVRHFFPIAITFRNGNILKHSTIVLAAIPALFLATTAGAATITVEHTVLSTHSDTSADDYDSRGNSIPGDCDVVLAIGQSTNCEEEFNLSLPEAEFQDTHNLESIAANVVLAYEVSAGVSAYDGDFGESGPGCDLTTFSDCQIDLSLSYSDTVQFGLRSALGG
jgi:hypothetical protein